MVLVDCPAERADLIYPGLQTHADVCPKKSEVVLSFRDFCLFRYAFYTSIAQSSSTYTLAFAKKEGTYA
jgi:hypothetical protein